MKLWPTTFRSFRLRTLFVAVAVLCAALAYLAYVRQSVSRQRQIIAELNQQFGVQVLRLTDRCSWPGKLFGDDFCLAPCRAQIDRPVTWIQSYPKIYSNSRGRLISDAEKEELAAINSRLATEVGRSEMFALISQLTGLEEVILQGWEINVELIRGLASCRGIPNVEVSIPTPLDDASLTVLIDMRDLRRLTLFRPHINNDNPSVSPQALEYFRKQRPDVVIE